MDKTVNAIGIRRDKRDFSVTDTRPIGGSYFGSEQPFIFSKSPFELEEYDDYSPPILSFLHEAFRFVPENILTFSAMCNGAHNHRILGELMLHFGSTLGGIVDFDGSPVPPDAIDELVKTIAYRSASGLMLPAQFARPEFLRSWLNHPQFQMVK